ncbi:MAG: NAD(P)H-hydrate dehydratase [Sneathiella sp.]
MTSNLKILSVEQMYEADSRTIQQGVSGKVLMENAGQGVTAFIEEGWDICRAAILCGPGNNGGDGYVIARALRDAGWPVKVYAYGDVQKLSGDAEFMFQKIEGNVEPLTALDLDQTDLVVDALFGAGFRGAFPTEIETLFDTMQSKSISIVCVDVPSGMDGNSGEVAKGTPCADLTVSFCRPKTGHLFYPAIKNMGRFEVIDIGISDEIIDDLKIQVFENAPDLWLDLLPVPSAMGHKYDRGHCTVMGGGLKSMGAARIAARCALRSGAGAVTLLCAPSALMAYSISLDAVMVQSLRDPEDLGDWLATKRIASILIGPGNGVSDRTRANVIEALKSKATVILDADALTVFKDDPDLLFDKISKKEVGHVILTPHEAEFARIFEFEGTALERCQKAALRSGAIVVLKGASTIISEPTGRTVINTNATPWLATAGSGDSLAGIISGLIAASMPCFEATTMGVWMHGEAGIRFGPGLIAEDIEAQIPRILADLLEIITDE